MLASDALPFTRLVMVSSWSWAVSRPAVASMWGSFLCWGGGLAVAASCGAFIGCKCHQLAVKQGMTCQPS